jgi:hypothetical protein
MKFLRWFVVYVALWMIASMLVTRIFHWPKESEMTPYQRTTPGQISTLIGASLPSAATGIVLGPLGPFLFSYQQILLTYGRTFDSAMVIARRTHPGWTEEQCRLAASETVGEAGKALAIVAFVLGIVVIVIAWVSWPRSFSNRRTA